MSIFTVDDLPELESAYKKLMLGQRIVRVTLTTDVGSTTTEYANNPASRAHLKQEIDRLKGRSTTRSFSVFSSKY